MPQTPAVYPLANNWQFRKIGGTEWLPATVPGTVHTDLFANGNIPDPFYGTNETSLQWIEREDWEYRCIFSLDSSLILSRHIELACEGLDTYADVYLNEVLIISASNMFRTYSEECKPLFREGENTLRIVFHSPIKMGDREAGKYPYAFPPGESKVHTRKAPYHYGWDWGPRFVTSGIWRNIYFRTWNDDIIRDLYYRQDSVSSASADLTLIAEYESTIDQMFTIQIKNVETQEVYITDTASVHKGKNRIEKVFSIKEPKLWWCNGLGAPELYPLEFTVIKQDASIITETKKIGIRTIELIQEKDSAGSSFYFKLNGIPVYMKGANYIPSESFLPRVTDEKYTTTILAAKNAGMNMLRVWGGGVYEKDIFYDLCDENGILVWQDFMFACAMYPADEEFAENVRIEAEQNIKRLRNHACIALWCGNNEVDEAWHNWGWVKQNPENPEYTEAIWNAYETIFHKILPEAVRTFHPGMYYHPSSPKHGWGRPESLKEGDSHYWGVWWGEVPFASFKSKVGRFMSEYGFQSMPHLETIKSFAPDSALRLNSKIILAHQKSGIGFDRINKYMEREYPIPSDFEHYLYISQLLQMGGIVQAIEAQRRAMPYCMGSLYWQLNDCWPVISWSSLDSYLRPKALHYALKRAFAPQLISIDENLDTLRVYIVNDALQDIKTTLVISVLSFLGDTVFARSVPVTIKSNSSGIYSVLSRDELLKGFLPQSCFLKAQLIGTSDYPVSLNYYFDVPKNLKLEDPALTFSIKKGTTGFALSVTARSLAKNVFFSLDGDYLECSDNYFDILPGETITLYCITNLTEEEFRSKLKLFSLYDVAR